MATPAVPQTNKLVGYVPQGAPQVQGITPVYLLREFNNIRTAIKSIQQIMEQLEARLASGGL